MTFTALFLFVCFIHIPSKPAAAAEKHCRIVQIQKSKGEFLKSAY